MKISPYINGDKVVFITFPKIVNRSGNQLPFPDIRIGDMGLVLGKDNVNCERIFVYRTSQPHLVTLDCIRLTYWGFTKKLIPLLICNTYKEGLKEGWLKTCKQLFYRYWLSLPKSYRSKFEAGFLHCQQDYVRNFNFSKRIKYLFFRRFPMRKELMDWYWEEIKPNYPELASWHGYGTQ